MWSHNYGLGGHCGGFFFLGFHVNTPTIIVTTPINSRNCHILQSLMVIQVVSSSVASMSIYKQILLLLPLFASLPILPLHIFKFRSIVYTPLVYFFSFVSGEGEGMYPIVTTSAQSHQVHYIIFSAMTPKLNMMYLTS